MTQCVHSKADSLFFSRPSLSLQWNVCFQTTTFQSNQDSLSQSSVSLLQVSENENTKSKEQSRRICYFLPYLKDRLSI